MVWNQRSATSPASSGDAGWREQHLDRLLADLARGVLARAVQEARGVGRLRVGVPARLDRGRELGRGRRRAPAPKQVLAAGVAGRARAARRRAARCRRRSPGAPTRRRARCRDVAALLPQLAAGAAPERRPPRRQRALAAPRRSCQATISTVAGGGVLADARHQPVGVVADGVGEPAERQRIGSPRAPARRLHLLDRVGAVVEDRGRERRRCSRPRARRRGAPGPPAPPEAIDRHADALQDLAEQVERVAACRCRRCPSTSPAARRRRARRPPRPRRRRRASVGRRPPDS